VVHVWPVVDPRVGCGTGLLAVESVPESTAVLVRTYVRNVRTYDFFTYFRKIIIIITK
jgi:hypothetical protein